MPNSKDFNRFAVNPVNLDISRSLFNMDHSVKFSCNVGECIPFDCIEVLPGDTFSIDTSKVVRLQPLVAPIMDEVILDTYWFFVPNRLVWSHWINFMGENNESAWTPETQYNIPTLKAPSKGGSPEQFYWDVGTIADYLGIPVGSSNGPFCHYSALPFRAYALICDQWFRSEAVMDPVHVFVDDTDRDGSNGSDQVSDIELGGKPFIACKYFDYFTGCLPAPQRGDPVSIKAIKPDYLQVHPYKVPESSSVINHPYSDLSDLKPGSLLNDSYGPMHFSYFNTSLTSDHYLPLSAPRNTFVSSDGRLTFDPNNPPTDNSNFGLYPDNLFVHLGSSDIQSISINDLRTAFAIQKYLEKQARYGGRYQEFIKAFFNVDSPDARLQRTEYLGGSRLSLNINSVEQTSATTSGTTPLGNVAGMSVTGDSNSDFTKSFTEHGFVIGIAVARYHHSYQDSIHKMWLRETKYDFYNPIFANLGEQAVNTKELYGYNFSPNQTFGYQERWAEYRYQPSRVAGEMRSVYSTPLDMWHLGDHYSNAPTLSPEWLREDKTNLDRCLAVTSDVSNQIICDFYIETEASRPMPLYSIPGLIDHH